MKMEAEILLVSEAKLAEVIRSQSVQDASVGVLLRTSFGSTLFAVFLTQIDIEKNTKSDEQVEQHLVPDHADRFVKRDSGTSTPANRSAYRRALE